jgi:peptide/nickel transport system permease protein
MITRLTRSLVLSEKNKTYVEAARSLGYSDRRILFLHIFPNCIETLVVQITVTLAQAILDLAALSFLGLGVQAPTADWGIMLQEGRQYLLTNPLIALFPGIAIVTIIISINILSDGLQMYWDPKQKKLPYKFSLLSKSTTKLPGTARTQIFSIGQEVSNV